MKLLVLLAMLLSVSAMASESTMIDSRYEGGCKSLNVSKGMWNSDKAFLFSEDLSQPFQAYAAPGFNTDTQVCEISMRVIVPGNHVFMLRSHNAANPSEGYYSGYKEIADTTSSISYTVSWDLIQDVTYQPYQTHTHTFSSTFANYFGGDLIKVAPTQRTNCKEYPREVDVRVRIEIGASSSEANYALHKFRGTHIKTHTAPCTPIESLPSAPVTFNPFGPITGGSTGGTPVTVLWTNKKGVFAGAVEYLNDQFNRKKVKGKRKDFSKAISLLTATYYEELETSEALKQSHRAVMPILQKLQAEDIRLRKRPGRKLYRSGRSKLRRIVNQLAASLRTPQGDDSNQSPSCQDDLKKAQRKALRKLGVNTAVGTGATLGMNALRTFVLSSPKEVFSFLIRWMAPEAARNLVFGTTLSTISSAAVGVVAAAFLTRQALLINKVVQLGKMRKLLKEVESGKPGKAMAKEYKRLKKTFKCKEKANRTKCKNNLRFTGAPGLFPGELADLSSKKGYDAYMAKSAKSRAFCNGSVSGRLTERRRFTTLRKFRGKVKDTAHGSRLTGIRAHKPLN